MTDLGHPSAGRSADTTKTYTTRSGKRVVLHETVPLNSAGAHVTFPIKGCVVERETPRKKTRLQIWTPDGRADVIRPHPDDLVDFPPLLGLARTACGCMSGEGAKNTAT